MKVILTAAFLVIFGSVSFAEGAATPTPPATPAASNLVAVLKGACRSDLEAGRSYFTHDYFRRKLTGEAQRELLAGIIDANAVQIRNSSSDRSRRVRFGVAVTS